MTDIPQEPNILVIGVGNPARGDDVVGLSVARQVAAMKIAGVRVVEATQAGIELVDVWQDYALVIIIDAVSSSAPPGTIHRLDPLAQSLPTNVFHCSSHSFGIAEAIELARTFHQLPPHLTIYGIEGQNFGLDTTLSKDVALAEAAVVAQVSHDCMAFQRLLPLRV